MKIFQIDDLKSGLVDVERGLANLGLSPDITFVAPDDRDEPFGGVEMPVGTEWDEFDLALVDLELFPPESLAEPASGDLRGGSEVLPYIRRHAPWLPVIGYSKLFDEKSQNFFQYAAGYGFDGHLRRNWFLSHAIRKADWVWVVERARKHRLSRLYGDTYPGDSVPEIEVAAPLEGELNESLPGWRSLAESVFHFSSRLVIERLADGFSGARVLRVFARQQSQDGGREGQWLFKISTSPRKLQDEVEAHLTMVRGGYDFARAVPLLWGGVARVEGVAGIAYQFAPGTRTVLAAARAGETDLSELDERLTTLLTALNDDLGSQRVLVSRLMEDWFGRREVALRELDDVEHRETVGVLRGAELRALREVDSDSLNASAGLLHGDLHLENVLIGDSDLLIDFARSAPGPVALDVARMFADVVARWPDGLRVLASERPGMGLMESFPKLCRALLTREDDVLLVELLLQAHLATILTYPDIADGRKAAIKDFLARLPTE